MHRNKTIGLDADQGSEMEEEMDYKKAGVDIEAGYKSVELMKKLLLFATMS